MIDTSNLAEFVSDYIAMCDGPDEDEDYNNHDIAVAYCDTYWEALYDEAFDHAVKRIEKELPYYTGQDNK